MFDRLQKPYLTVETGEAYQPIRLTYQLIAPERLEQVLESLHCLKKNRTPHSWSWYWSDECADLQFESINTFQKNPESPLRLGTISVHGHKLFLNLTSFKRACLAVPFFHRWFDKNVLVIHSADFINKVFSLNEQLPHGFAELFKEDELDHLLSQRVADYHDVKEKVELASSAEDALDLLVEYSTEEASKQLPYAERYLFDIGKDDNLDVIFLAFYIYLQGRELVAIKRWSGVDVDHSDDTLARVFGELGVDIIE